MIGDQLEVHRIIGGAFFVIDDDVLNVPINPADLKQRISTSESDNLKRPLKAETKADKALRDKQEADKGSDESHLKPPKITVTETISMNLIFDQATMYEENGSVAKLLISTMPLADSVLNRYVPNLFGSVIKLKCAAQEGKIVSFKYGHIEISGKIVSYNDKYTYFDVEGIPLRAEVSLTIKSESGGTATDSKNDAKSPTREALAKSKRAASSTSANLFSYN